MNIFTKFKKLFRNPYKDELLYIDPLIMQKKETSSAIISSVMQTIDTIKKEFNEDPSTIAPISNPLIPYLKEYNYPVQHNNDRLMDEATYLKTFKEYISIKNFLNAEKAPFLKKMWDDAKFVYDALDPLRQLNINYTIDLTGGCVRDFVLNQHTQIKDLDFMISIPNAKNGHIYEVIDSNIFSKEELEAVNFSAKDEFSIQKVKLIQMCMNRTKDLSHVFSFNTEERKYQVRKIHVDYDTMAQREDRLMGVFKLNGKQTHYPIDLLLTDFVKPKFIELFDFDICKASFCIVNNVYNKSFPTNYSHLLSRFSAEIGFWADVVNKKITYDCSDRSVSQINRSFGSHLERIEIKYPDYQVLIKSGYGEDDSSFEHATKLLHAIQLDKSLPKKDTNIPAKRTKI